MYSQHSWIVPLSKSWAFLLPPQCVMWFYSSFSSLCFLRPFTSPHSSRKSVCVCNGHVAHTVLQERLWCVPSKHCGIKPWQLYSGFQYANTHNNQRRGVSFRKNVWDCCMKLLVLCWKSRRFVFLFTTDLFFHTELVMDRHKAGRRLFGVLLKKFFVQMSYLNTEQVDCDFSWSLITAALRREETSSLMVPGCKLQERVECNEL